MIKAKQVFGQQITKQFSSWGLTQSESDAALLTLKGFNSKEIASLRDVAEKTVRNQLSAVYRKSQLDSKHHFIPYFMDDLM